MSEQQLGMIIEALNDLLTDSTVPKNVKIKVETIINTLKDKSDVSMKVNRVLNDLDEITGDINLQSYTRTQLYNIVSLLEKV